jgi:MFS family permease
MGANDPTACPLTEREQMRNVILFGVNTWLFYIAAPVLLVGNTQATLCKKLGASDTVCNLPGAAYLVMASAPILVAWLFPQVALFKRILIVSYAILAGTGAAVAAVLVMPLPDWIKIIAVILEGALTGGALTVATMFLFEMLGRGVEESRRGLALGMGYGLGPILAALGSLLSQLLLAGHIGPLSGFDFPFPRNFAALIALTAPLMTTAALLSTYAVIPLPEREQTRLPFRTAIADGLAAFWDNPVLRLTAIIGILMFCGYEIGPNMTLYTKEVLGKSPDEYVGYQNTVRFTFKVLSGILAGWIVTWSGPRTALWTTGLFGFAAVIWVMGTTPEWFLLSFGLLGAGELFGVYITNFILSCSSPADTRRNMGFASLMMIPAAPAGALFGAISDYFGQVYSKSTGFRASFALAALCLGSGLALTLLLPSRPRPITVSDQSPGS